MTAGFLYGHHDSSSCSVSQSLAPRCCGELRVLLRPLLQSSSIMLACRRRWWSWCLLRLCGAARLSAWWPLMWSVNSVVSVEALTWRLSGCSAVLRCMMQPCRVFVLSRKLCPWDFLCSCSVCLRMRAKKKDDVVSTVIWCFFYLFFILWSQEKQL